MKNVLIIEDDKSLRSRYERELEWKVKLSFAWSKKDAIEMVRNKLWDIISFDLFLAYEEEDDEPKDTLDLIVEVKNSWFMWDMIAASSEDIYRKDQIKAWCNKVIENKKRLAELILSLI